MPHWPDCMEGPQIEDRLDSSGPYCAREIRSRSNNHRPLRSNLRPHHVVGWTAPTANRRRGRGRSRKGGTGAAPQESSLHIDRKVRARENGERKPLRRSEEHTSELQSLMRISYAVFCLKKKTHKYTKNA